MVLCVYSGKRFYRYRKKYENEREAVDKMQDEVQEMEEYGAQAGTKDDEVVMNSNPLVMQLAEMKEKMNETDRKMREEEQAQSQLEQEERRSHIAKLQTERDKMALELEKLQESLAKQKNAPKKGPAMEFIDENGGGGYQPPAVTNPMTTMQAKPRNTNTFQARPNARRKKDL